MARKTGSQSTLPLTLEQLTAIFADTPKAQIPVSVGFLRAAQVFLRVEIPGLEKDKGEAEADEQGAPDAKDAKAPDAGGGAGKAQFEVE